jgi:dephospho-CoA kinase
VKVIGLTGGIATGKSTAAAFFRSRGVPIVDADAWAHRLLMPGQTNYVRVLQAFGPEILKEDKTIDRKRLGQLVFADPELRKDLEALTHPAIITAIQNELNQRKEEGASTVILDHPLLFETNMDELVDEVWVIATSPEVQRERLAERDGLSKEAVELRLAAQMPLNEKVRRADLVIWNNQGIDELNKLLESTWKERILCHRELPS